MSGGLDSTSLAALAAEELAATPGSAPVRAVSWVFDELEALDERRYIEPVIAKCDLRPVQFPVDDAWPLHYPDSIGFNPNTPLESPHRRLRQCAYRASASAGAPVLLDGAAADGLYTGFELWLADLLRDREVVEAAVALVRTIWRRGLGNGLRLTGFGLGLRRLRETIPRWRELHRRRTTYPWLTARAQALLEGDRENGKETEATAIFQTRRPQQAWALLGQRTTLGYATEVYHAHRGCIDLRQPYRDRRIVELMLAVPAYQLCRRQQLKWIARNAMAGRLPDVTRLRQDPTLLDPLFWLGVREKEKLKVEDLLFAPRASWQRFVQEGWVRRIREAGGERASHPVVLWRCICWEAWRRANRSRSAGSLHGASDL